MWTRTFLALGILAVAGALWLAVRGNERLPARVHTEEILRDLSATLDPATITAEAPDARVRLGGLRPSQSLRAEGGNRRALIAPPPAAVRFRVPRAPGTALRFGIGVEGSGRREPDAAGVRFRVSVDGRDVFARVLNPAATRHERQWFDERVALSGDRGDAEVTLRTEAAGAGRLAGVPGWSDVRVVREGTHERQAASAGAPSVVFIVVDTLRADSLGCYGASPSPSPTLDALAARGVLFETMVSQSSWTMPAAATLLTGLHPRDHGLVGWAGGALPNAIPTLAERAALAGITTFGVSANPLVSRRTNFARGFETFSDLGWEKAQGDWPTAAEVNRPFLHWLERARGHRFLAYLHYMEPHDPYRPPDGLRPAAPAGMRDEILRGDIDQLARRSAREGAAVVAAGELAHLRALYDGEVRAWDQALAEVLGALRRLGLEDSTILVVTADHGEEFLEHGRLKHGSHLYEESLRVPLVLAGPGLAPGRPREPAQSIDLFPTLARLLGIDLRQGLPGQDLLRAPAVRPVFSETDHGVGTDGAEIHVVSARTSHWKLVHTPALARFELYDLARDPAERSNVFGTAPEGDELRAILAHWEAAAPPAPEPVGTDPALHEKLRALGYVN